MSNSFFIFKLIFLYLYNVTQNVTTMNSKKNTRFGWGDPIPIGSFVLSKNKQLTRGGKRYEISLYNNCFNNDVIFDKCFCAEQPTHFGWGSAYVQY